jgi:hypothetical protein
MRRFFLLAAVLVSAAACQNDVTGPNVQLAGTYNLRTINGQTLPFTFTNNNTGQLETVTNDQLTLFDDGSYRDVATLEDNSGTFTSTELGTYSAVNGSITFFDQTDNVQFGGSLSGNVLTEISNNGTLTEVFQKQ